MSAFASSLPRDRLRLGARTVIRTGAWLALMVVLVTGSGSGQVPRSVSLEEALEAARRNHPILRAARAEVDAALGEVQSASVLRFNPAITAGVGPARSTDTSFTNVEIGVAQTFELGGKRGGRTAIAGARLEATEFRLARTEFLLDVRVKRAYYRGLIFQRRVAATEQALRLAEELREATEARLRLGAGTQLEVNLAVSGMARSAADHLRSESRYRSAILELATASGFDPSEEIVPGGTLPTVSDPATIDVLLVTAFSARNDLGAVSAERRAAVGGVALSRAQLWPDVTIGAGIGRAEDFRTGGLSVGLSVPLWNRNGGARQSARADVARWEALEDDARREVEREVRDAWQWLARARAAESAFGLDAVERLSENLELARQSFEAGKINLVDFSVVRRELIDTQLTYLDTRAEVIDAVSALETAVGQPLIPEAR